MNGDGLQMCKTPLSTEQKVFDAGPMDTDAEENVKRAAKWSVALWNRAYQGMGDTQEAAMYRVAEQTGVDPGTFWALRYRKPKGILAHILARLYVAHENLVGGQEAKLRHELEITKMLPATPARAALVAEVEALLGQAAGSEAGTGPARFPHPSPDEDCSD